MNFRITLTILLTAFMAMGMSAQAVWGGPGDPNGEFDGGLNDWTTVGLTSAEPDSAKNSIWVWDEDATPNEGGYTSGSGVLASPSAANGAALFNSDFYDNAGVQGSFGSGISPSPHSGELISPIIDLSGEPAPTLTFYQRFINFQASTIVNVSGDGGKTFTSFPVNEDVGVNASSGDTFISINITEVAGGQDSVVVKFTFDGDYYYWIIDDVAIIPLPDNDLTIIDDNTSPFYTPHSAAQPACAIEVDTFSFSANVTNSGADTIMSMVYKVEIYNDDSEDLVHVDSVIVSEWAPTIADSSVTIPDTWAPEGLELGLYRIVHSVSNLDDPDDFNPGDNSAVQFFQVTESTFSKDLSGDGGFGTWNGGEFYAIAAFYQFGPNCMENYTVSSIDYAVGQVGADEEPLEGRPVEFWLWKLTTLLDSFDTSTNYQEDILTISHPSMEFVGFSPDVLDADDVAADIIASDEPFLNADGDEINPIFEAGATYGVFAHWGTQETTSPLHLFVDDVNSGTDLFYSDGWFGGFSGSKSAPILRLRLSLFSSVDDQPLADEAFRAYPNPTSDLINLELNLETNMDATVTIADITGRVISYQNLSKVQNDVLTINVSTYSAGTYLARVATERGTKTVKFVVN